jgi:hypothetical protein
VPVSDLVLTQAPAEEHGLVPVGMPCGEIDEALVQILHLHAELLELRDRGGDRGGGAARGFLQIAHPTRI